MLRLTRPAIALIVAAIPFSALAQTPPSPTSPPGGGLAPAPLVNEALGLRMFPPDNSRVTPTQSGDQIMVEVTEAVDPPTWAMTIQPVITALPNPTADALAEVLTTPLRQMDPPPLFLADDAITINGRRGRIIYYRDTGEDSLGLTAGLLLLPTGEQRFMVFRIAIRQNQFERVRPLLDRSFATIELFSKEQIDARRQAQLDRAAKAIASLTEEKYRALIGTRQWYRLYRPDPAGQPARDVEIGYVRIEVAEEPRGALTPERDAANYTPSERVKGIMLRVNARVIIDAPRGIYADQQSLFWQTYDRSEELWSIRVTSREGQRSYTEGESGIREGHPYSKITVVTNQRETLSRSEFTFIVPEEPFLSQLEVFMLGSLLPRDGSISGEMAFRYYEPSQRDQRVLPSRLDTWRPLDDRSGRWLLTSELLAGTPAVESTFSREGALMRREKPDGSLTLPAQVDEILRVWRAKGLPTE